MKKFLSLVLALIMTMSLVTISAGAKDYTDDSKINYEEAVDVVSAIDIVGGYADGSFNPSATLTRGAASKIICNLILGPTTASALSADAAPYKDVPANSTFAGYIAYCQKQGIISGYADGTFKPGNTLTGYAFMKMLLGALGYDASLEGYTGANWSISVAKQAIAIGLDDGLVDDFNGVKAVTREEACLFAFNTLQAKTVTYDDKGTSITIGDTTITSGASKPDEGVPFMSKYFKKLVKNTDTDAFQRPATTWTNNGKKIGTYADAPVVSYTKKVDGKTIYTDLGLATAQTAAYVDVYKNGVSVDAGETITKGDEDTEFGGAGILTEVFKVERGDNNVWNANSDDIVVVSIETQLGKITKVGTNDDDNRYVKVGGIEYETEEFAKDQWVLYTKEVDGTPSIKSMAAAEALTGKLTKYTNNKYTIDGTVYEKAKNGTDSGAVVGKNVKFYLNEYGYIMDIDLETDAVTVDNLAVVLEDGQARGNYAVLRYAADGKKATVDTDAAYDYATAGGDYYVVSFKDTDSGVKLTPEMKVVRNVNLAFDNQKPQITNGAGTNLVSVDSKTNFLVKSVGTDTTWTTYVGYKNLPSFSDLTGSSDYAYVTNSDGDVIFVYISVPESKIEGNADKLTVVGFKASNKLVYEDGFSYYEYNTGVDGADGETIKIDPSKWSDLTTHVIFKSVKTNSKGVVTGLTAATTYNTATAVKVSGETIKLDGVAYGYTDDVAVYSIDTDTSAVLSTGLDITDINEDDDTVDKNDYTAIHFITNTKGVVTTIVLFEA